MLRAGRRLACWDNCISKVKRVRKFQIPNSKFQMPDSELIIPNSAFERPPLLTCGPVHWRPSLRSGLRITNPETRPACERRKEKVGPFVSYFLCSWLKILQLAGCRCHCLRRFRDWRGTRPTSCDVGYINPVVSDYSSRPAKAGIR